MRAKLDRNPFEITKATDFSDDQILSTWVESLGGRRLVDWVAPRSPMPMLILGGKGSGKTHLMRYLSLSLQVLRHRDDLLKGVVEEGYLGVYLRSSGLNARRFGLKGQTEEQWVAVFAQYMDLWLAQLALGAVATLIEHGAIDSSQEPEFCRRLKPILRGPEQAAITSVGQMMEECRRYQRHIDDEVNNAALRRTVAISVRTTPGELVFGIPAVISATFRELAGVQVVYLIDELENFDELQQQYINTLVRERNGPCSIRVGSRTWGVRTYRVLNSPEENRRGSEFEVLHLDRIMRQEGKAYGDFCKELVARRLREATLIPSFADEGAIATDLESAFQMEKRSRLGDRETGFVRQRSGPRPHMFRLRQQLEAGMERGIAVGLTGAEAVNVVTDLLNVPEHPLVEKAAILLFYRDWSDKKDLMQAASRLHAEIRAFIAAPLEESRIKATLDHFRADLVAQLRRDYHLSQRYLGLKVFIALSSGLPKNLLILLKYIYQWAVYNGESPFGDTPISEESQRLGVVEAADWFYWDSKVRAEEGEAADAAIQRLGTLFRAVRYSDKPSECSLIAFSLDASQLAPAAKRIVQWAENRGLLIPVQRGQRDRNKPRVDDKYQLNGMLCPRWDLAAFRRGAIGLNSTEANAIFGAADGRAFDELLDERVGRMMAPGFGRQSAKTLDHPVLPGLENE